MRSHLYLADGIISVKVAAPNVVNLMLVGFQPCSFIQILIHHDRGKIIYLHGKRFHRSGHWTQISPYYVTESHLALSDKKTSKMRYLFDYSSLVTCDEEKDMDED